MIGNELRVSIVIPTYNRPGALAACLDSLEKQTVAPHEVIIVVDGGITKEVQRVIDIFKSKNELNIVQINNRERRGMQVSRNIGAEAASGDIIAFLCDDITLVPEWLAEILRGYWENKDAAGVGGRVIQLTPFMDSTFYRLYYRVRRFLFSNKLGKISFIGLPYIPIVEASERLLSVDYLAAGNMALRRDVFHSYKFDTSLEVNNELDLGIRLTKRGKKKLIYNSKAIVYHSFLSGGSGYPGRGTERLYGAFRDHTIYLLKNFNAKYLRLAFFSATVLIYSL
ncbi:MAG: glycosyltransferase family 2 protein, partial [Candidatus Omnitrophica bacterium]|nr:glycosyltransferase family 2 protein [Candidatus Omnitrophota bacterium]